MYYASAEQMAKLDDVAVDSGLEIRQMMELAGWHMLQLFERLKISPNQRVAIIVGKGNKGGDGLSAARHLANYGHQVEVFLLEHEISQDAHHQLELLQKMGVTVNDYKEQQLSNYGVIIDSLVGYRMKGSLEGKYASAVTAMNRSSAIVIAYDVPSGVLATSGDVDGPVVQAEFTLMLALAKSALKGKNNTENFGKVYLADIGIPTYAYNEISPGSRPVFDADGLVLLT